MIFHKKTGVQNQTSILTLHHVENVTFLLLKNYLFLEVIGSLAS